MYSCRVNKSGSTFLTHEHSSVDFCKLLNEKGFYGTQPIFFVVQVYQVVAIQVADLNFILSCLLLTIACALSSLLIQCVALNVIEAQIYCTDE